MPTRHPPRREPRALAIVATAAGFAWAVADPWELRATGIVRCAARSRSAVFRLLCCREKPTVVVAKTAALTGIMWRAAQRIPILRARLRSPPKAVARDLYPELALFAPSRALDTAARLAIAAVLHSPIPSRSYAPRRHRTPPRSA
jgi:hypothetical protein